ncbi:MAG: hypothetical protein SOY42_04540 [Clostridium sp.]|nr:hypothetical protein [Clostridium sp.]
MNEKLRNLKNKKVIFLVISIIIAFIFGMFFASSLNGKEEKVKETPLNSTVYNSEVLEFLNSIAGIKAENLEIISDPVSLQGTLFAPKESILNGINYFLEKTENEKMKNVALYTEKESITISVDYKVTKKISTPIEVKISPKLNDNKDLVINIDELKLLDIKLPKWIVNLIMDSFVKDWFPEEDKNIQFTKGAVIIDKESFNGVELENLEVENEGLRIKLVINLAETIKK